VQLEKWSKRFLVTQDFAKTIAVSNVKNAVVDDYLRPVRWIVSSRALDAFVIMSPFEVNELFEDVRSSKHVSLHMYAPRITKSMRNLDHLDLYVIGRRRKIDPTKQTPLSLKVQLNLFAGQLYLEGQAEYEELCRFLGLYTHQSNSEVSPFLNVATGYVSKKGRQALGIQGCPFDPDPVPFIRAMIAMRRRGTHYTSTHLGQILHGRVLDSSTFEARW
jgi:hypothetical protein